MDKHEMNELPDWQLEEMEEELEFLKHEEDYEALPRELDINSYRIMEKFIFSLNDDEQVSILQEAIQGKGAFGRFRNKAANLGLLEKWYQFRRECHQEIAIDWCEQKGITYE
ncbi:UPF0158 family protein [Paenibacillus sp. JGP012]|uniref:UPF0158 family protein n=1 Tax=Paenibacillus sp. JGP012 TaxID=2735914 RepID=UPI0016073757|nr:UPF0158 family protein [Paenibacillus sp. JGP012]